MNVYKLSNTMTGLVELALLATTSITAVMEPASTISVYITLSSDLSESERGQIIKKSMNVSFWVLAFFALTGQLFFLIFNITIAAFQIAGGILLVFVALRMLSSKRESTLKQN